MRKFSNKAVAMLLAGSLVLGSLTNLALAGTGAHAKQITDQKAQEKNYKEGEAIVLYYASEFQTASEEKGKFGSGIEVKKTWDFGKVEKARNQTGKTASASNATEIVARVSSKEYSTEELIEQLKENSSVQFVEPNYIFEVSEFSEDTYSSYQWGLNNTGQNAGTVDSDINVDTLWKDALNPTTGTQKVIAVIDTGVDYTHEDLANNMWVNPFPSSSGLLGVHGYDFANNDSDPDDDMGHGTHVAGIIAAAANSKGVTGVNQDAKIMALKFIDRYNVGTLEGAIAAYEYIYAAQLLGVDIVAINNSWGGADASEILNEVINRVGENGALSICAAGNDAKNTDIYFNAPSSIDSPYIISVAASNEKDELASFSNYGMETVDLVAPGTNILSSVNENIFNPTIYVDGDAIDDKNEYCDYYNNFTTTSSFSPYILLKNDEQVVANTGIELQQVEFFGETGDSLHWRIEGAQNGDVYKLYFPYMTQESSSPIYDSAMIKMVNQADCSLYMVDYLLEGSGDLEKEIGSMSGNAATNYWDHLYGINSSDSVAGQKRGLTFEVWVRSVGAIDIYIDDIAVSKANISEEKFGKYDFYNGTSMAAPYVTGAVALASEYWSKIDSHVSADVIRKYILSSVRKVNALNGKVASGGVMDLNFIYQPYIKSAAVNAQGNIDIEGVNFSDSPGTIKVNGTSINSTNYTWSNSKITVMDKTLLDTNVTFEVTTTLGSVDYTFFADSAILNVLVSGIQLNATQVTLEAGQALNLSASIQPENATNKGITWFSTDNTAVLVDAMGKVTALETGVGKTVTIFANSKDKNGLYASCKVSVIKKATGLTITGASTELIAGTTLLLKASVSPQNVTNAAVTWSSSDSTAATVDTSGNVTALETGTGKLVTITATANDGSGIKAHYSLTIIKKVAAIKINASSSKMKVGIALALTTAIAPANATNQAVTWSSSNKKYATVDANGKVKANKAGGGKSVIILATAVDGSGVTATYKISIAKKRVTKIKLNKTTVSVKANKKITLKATITPSTATNKKVKWTSSNKKYATVNSKGVVTAKKAGKGKTVKITAAAVDGSKVKKSCKVKIK